MFGRWARTGRLNVVIACDCEAWRQRPVLVSALTCVTQLRFVPYGRLVVQTCVRERMGRAQHGAN